MTTLTSSIDLTPYLESIGLRIDRVEGNEVRAWCPAHVDRTGKEDKRASFYFNQVRLVGHCFSCDWKAPTLDVLVEYMTGSPADGDVVIEAKKHALTAAVTKIAAARKIELADSPRYMEWALSHQFKSVPAVLLEMRKITRAAADRFQVRWDPTNKCQVLPIRTPFGTLIGWQQRQRGSVYNYPKEVQKSGTLFGLREVESDKVALVESPLDVVRMWQAGVPAVASYGAEVSNRQIELCARNFGVVVLALDNDVPGNKAASRVRRALGNRTGVIQWDYTDATGKDPGDYKTDQEITDAWKRTLRLGL